MLQILCMYVQNVLSKDLEDSRITERKLLAASAVFLIHFITNLVKCMNAQVTHKPIVRNMLHTWWQNVNMNGFHSVSLSFLSCFLLLLHFFSTFCSISFLKSFSPHHESTFSWIYKYTCCESTLNNLHPKHIYFFLHWIPFLHSNITFITKAHLCISSQDSNSIRFLSLLQVLLECSFVVFTTMYVLLLMWCCS